MDIKKIIAAITVFIIATAALSAKEGEAIRIAYFPNITHAQALVGKENNEYQKAVGNVKIEWKEFNAGSAEIEAFMAGAVDIGFIGPGPAVNGFIKTRGELQVISGASNGGAVLVTRKDLKITTINELSGKKIAIPQYGNTQDILLRNILNKSGLKDAAKGGTVSILQSENPDIKLLLDQGKIDAALVPEPWGARLVKEVGANIFIDYKEIWRNGSYTSALIIVRKEFAEKNPQIVENFIKAHITVTDFINKNGSAAKEMINKQIKEATGKNLAKEVLDLSFAKVITTYDPDTASVIEMANLSKQAGYLRSEPDLKNLFNYSIINKVLKEKKLKEIE